MSNGARHTWGFFAGVVLTAAIAALLIFGSYRLQHGYLTQFHKQDKWIGGGLLVGAAIVYAILVASRLSPLASLIGGIVLTAAGVLFFVSQKTTADLINRFPFKQQRVTLAGLEEEGFILFAGVGLLFSSFFPSRWRRRGEDDGSASGYEYGLPETRETRATYSSPDPASGPVGGPLGDPLAGRPIRDTVRDEQPTAQAPQYGGSAPGAYDGYDTQHQQPGAYETQHQPTSYDSPLYEPTQQQQPQYGSGRSPFSPPDEGGGTREMRRPE
jgi:hypothetical protein